MPWGVAAATITAGGSIAAANKAKKNGGAGTSTSSNEPWAATQPWLQELINQGTHLNNAYAGDPFSDAQQTAYNNQYVLSDSVRNALPGLFGALSGTPTSFDPTNPTARPKSFDWTSFMNGGLAGRSVMDSINTHGATTARWNPPSAAAPSGGESAPVAPAVTPNWNDMFMAGTGDRNANYLP
jgi:hypothetical protein